ncbi:MAG: glycosyltransferase family 9 protein [Chitinophagaceae bacterium]|nr:MAG: glycosyltransferase family 9 protein [Chitinophagaceae bacterium]
MKPKHILVFRFSALGDVAMTVPVLRLLLMQNPNLEITMVSVPFHQPLFEGVERLHFYGVDIKKEFKGIGGLRKLAKKLKAEIDFDAVADIHNVLRTKILRFFLSGKKSAAIDKGRKEKKRLTRPKNKELKPLRSSFKRYALVFEELGYFIDLKVADKYKPKSAQPDFKQKYSNKKLIGVAPFAQHASKMYPLDKMKKVVDLLATNETFELFVFSSKKEKAAIEDWTSFNVHLVAGTLAFNEELNLIGQLDLMLSMDSANMHLASMFGVPVVSVWGGTHPYLGFYGWGQDVQNAIQENLPCRPSSVFGNKECPVHGAAGCMQGITPEMVCDKILSLV